MDFRAMLMRKKKPAKKVVVVSFPNDILAGYNFMWMDISKYIHNNQLSSSYLIFHKLESVLVSKYQEFSDLNLNVNFAYRVPVIAKLGIGELTLKCFLFCSSPLSETKWFNVQIVKKIVCILKREGTALETVTHPCPWLDLN